MTAAILMFAMAMAASTTVSAQSLGGTYRVAGTNLNGSTYSGTATISFVSNENCRIRWVTGSTTSHGSCMRKGTTFAAGYILEGVVGLVVYEISPDGSMDGIWTLADKRGRGTEKLTPMR